jgi:hypothetical protein
VTSSSPNFHSNIGVMYLDGHVASLGVAITDAGKSAFNFRNDVSVFVAMAVI